MASHYDDDAMSESYSPEAFDRWKSGVAFSYAVVTFGDERLVRLFRDAATEGGILANRAMLVIDLWGRLCDGEFTAIGRRVAPTASDGPVEIPVHFFHDRLALSAGGADDLEMSGWRYESVRIVRSERPPAASIEADAPSTLPRKRGPKPFAPMIAAAIESLRTADHLFDDRSQGERIIAIQEEIAMQNPARFPKKVRPSRSVIWNYLTTLSS